MLTTDKDRVPCSTLHPHTNIMQHSATVIIRRLSVCLSVTCMYSDEITSDDQEISTEQYFNVLRIWLSRLGTKFKDNSSGRVLHKVGWDG